MPKQINLDVKNLRSVYIFRERTVSEQGEPNWRFRLVGEYELTDDDGNVLYSRQIEIMPDAAQQKRIDALYAHLLDLAQDQEGVKPQAENKSVAVAATTRKVKHE